MDNLAIWYRRFGAPRDVLTLEACKLDRLAAGRARVEMIAAPINPSDLIPVTGAYRHRIQPPQIAGYEGVGILMDADTDGPASLIGRRVLPLRGPGTWQRFVDCDPAWMIAVPDDVETDIAARAYINPLAAMLMLDGYDVAGGSVLITAAGSTCARLLGDWALAAGARQVIGVHRSDRHLMASGKHGIVAIADQDDGSILEAARGADLVLDAVGGPLADKILSGLAPEATFVSYGLLSGLPITPPARGPRPQRFHLRDHLPTVTPDVWQGWFARIWALLRQTPAADVVHIPVLDWKQALTLFDTPGRIAKPLLDFRSNCPSPALR